MDLGFEFKYKDFRVGMIGFLEWMVEIGKISRDKRKIHDALKIIDTIRNGKGIPALAYGTFNRIMKFLLFL